MYEHHREPLLPWPQFTLRVLCALVLTLVILIATVLVGTIGLHILEGLSWLDAMLNAVLIMTGLGLTVPLTHAPAKVFTSIYAISSAIIFFAGIAVLFSPLIHRALHHFHLDLEK